MCRKLQTLTQTDNCNIQACSSLFKMFEMFAHIILDFYCLRDCNQWRNYKTIEQ